MWKERSHTSASVDSYRVMFSEALRYTWSIVLVDMIFGNMLIRRRKKNKHTTGIVFLRNRYITELLHDKNPLEMFNTCDLMISVSFDCFRWPLINLRSYQAVLSVNTDKCYRIRTIGPVDEMSLLHKQSCRGRSDLTSLW